LLLKGLARIGSVELALILSDRPDTSQLDEDVQIHCIQKVARPPLELLSFSLRARQKIQELLGKGQVDIIHYTNDYCGFALPGQWIGKPLVATMHHPYALEAQVYHTEVGWHMRDLVRYQVARRPFLLNSLQRNLCNRSRKLIAVSRFSANAILREHKIPPDKVTVVPNGIDQEVFNPGILGLEMKQRWGFPSQRVLLFTGRLDYSKGLTYLIEAFNKIVQRVSDVRLVIVGEGILRNQLLRLARRRNLRNAVKFTGRLHPQDLLKAYAAADIVVCPSLMEGFGLSLLEAMAVGKPCVAAASGGMSELLATWQNGVLVPPADSIALQLAIETLLSDSNLCQRLGMAARKTVEMNFTLEKMAQRTLAVYHDVLNENCSD